MRKKILCGAFAMAMASLVAIGAGDVKADAAAADAKVTYTCGGAAANYTETLEVTEAGTSVEPYMFYTTTNVTAAAVPPNSKWMKISGDSSNGYKLDVSSYNGKTTFFFAQSPNPSSADDILKVVLPAKPALAGISYNVKAEADTEGNIERSMFNLSGMKLAKVKYTVPTPADVTSGADDAAIEALMPELGTAKNALNSQQSNKTYSVVYYNTADPIVYDTDATPAGGKEPCARFEVTGEGNGKYLRPSMPCTLKVTKPAAAPNITFNYANHTMALKKDMVYVNDADFNAIEMGAAAWSGATSVTAKTENIALESGKKYAVAATKKGIPTYIGVPVTEPFSGKVSVEGTLVKSQKDKVTLHLGAAGAGTMTYQYKIVPADEVTDYIDVGNACFKYDVEGAGDGWSSVEVKNTRDVIIGGSSLIGGKSIFVRVMKGKTSFSSNVVILNQPAEVGAGWLLAKPDATDLTAGAANATRGKAEYDPEHKTITIPFTGIKEKITLGADETRDKIQLSGGYAKAVEESQVTWIATDAATGTGNLAINMTGDTDFAKLDGKRPVTVTIPTGWLKDMVDENVLPAQTVSVSVDNVAPKVNSVLLSKDKAGNAVLTVTIDSPVKVLQGDDPDDVVEAGAEVGIDLDVKDIITVKALDGTGNAIDYTDKTDMAAIDSATLKLSGTTSIITLTLANMPTIADKIAKYKVTMCADITDLVGNAFDGSVEIPPADNKIAYKADAEAAVLTISEITSDDVSGGKVTVTVTSNKTLDVKSLTALKNAIVAETGLKVSGVTWTKPNLSFTFVVSGIADDTDTTTLATINADSVSEKIKDSEGFVLDAKVVGITAGTTE